MTDPLAKPATIYTKDANSNAAALINFDDDGDFRRAQQGLSLLTKQAELNLMEELSGTHLHMTFYAMESNRLKQCTLAYGDRGSSTPFMAS